MVIGMRQTSFAEVQCSLARSLEVIGDWWTPLIIRDLYLGIDRFDGLATDLGISRNLLTTRLAHLAEHGVVSRHRYSDHPPRDRYQLTEAGLDIVPVILALTAWGDRWATPPGGKPMIMRHRDCGGEFEPTVCCDACGERIGAAGVEVMPGPGARVGPGTMLIAQMPASAEEPSASARGK